MSEAEVASTDNSTAQAEAADGDAGKEPLPITVAEYRATFALLLMFISCILLAMAFAAPFADAGLQAFEDPDDSSNSLWYLVLILAFTAVILYIAKKGRKWMIQAIILAAVGATIMYVVAPLVWMHPAATAGTSWGIGMAIGAACVWWLYKNPEWYVIDFVGVLVAAGAASIFGISLSVVPVIVLLVALAIYDAIAVYKTKHMLSLADAVIELRLPVLLVIPKHAGYSFRDEASKFKEASAENMGEREAMFMGLGDLVMPTILVISALQFPGEGWGDLPAAGAAVGTLLGFLTLMTFVLRGNPQAGLPLLNGGAIAGFLVGLYAATGSIVFW